MTRILTPFAIFLIWLAAWPAAAQEAAISSDPLPEMAAIEQAWNRGDFVTVRAGLKRLATETGTPLAQYRYGRILLEGRGGPRDSVAAAEWLEKAVAQNHVEATTLLARMYLTGYEPGPAADKARAASLLSDAAARGDAEAQYYLALLYRAGDGVTQDDTASFTWMRAAAEKGNVEAQYELARVLARGIGTPADPEAAEAWLREAAGAGHVQAQFFLGQTLRARDKNNREALDWLRRAAEAGLPVAQRNLGMAYLTGTGVEADSKEALRWLNTAADQGDPGAWSSLGYAYASGTGVERNDETAVQWYERASNSGLGRSTLALARFYETGRGVAQDMDKAVELYRAAFDQGETAAAERLGTLTIEGALDGKIAPQRSLPWVAAAARAGQPEALEWLQNRADDMPGAALHLGLIALEGDAADTKAAAAWLEQAAQGGLTEAQFQLGTLYSTGNGVAQDYVQAHKWFNIAAARGHGGALQTRETLASLMTPEEIAAAQRAARAWFEISEPRPPEPVEGE